MNPKILFHNYWMKMALLEAKKGLRRGEVPIGAILLQNNSFISSGYNSCIMKNDPNAHAEILAIKRGGRIINNYRFKNTSLYVTHEPCFMCSGAILNARINKIIFGSYNTNNTGLFFFFKIFKN